MTELRSVYAQETSGSMDREKAIGLLQEQLGKIMKLSHESAEGYGFRKWLVDTEIVIGQVFGHHSSNMREFNSINYTFPYGAEDQSDEMKDRQFKRGLERTAMVLRAMIEEVQRSWT